MAKAIRYIPVVIIIKSCHLRKYEMENIECKLAKHQILYCSGVYTWGLHDDNYDEDIQYYTSTYVKLSLTTRYCT